MLAQFLAHTPANFVSFTDSFIVSFSNLLKRCTAFRDRKVTRTFEKRTPGIISGERAYNRGKGFNISGERANNRGKGLYPRGGLISRERACNRNKKSVSKQVTYQ